MQTAEKPQYQQMLTNILQTTATEWTPTLKK
jgi:hypothetical protein